MREWQLNLCTTCGVLDSEKAPTRQFEREKKKESSEKKIVSELKMLCKLDLTTLDIWTQHTISFRLTIMRTRASKIDFNFLHSHPIDSLLFFFLLLTMPLFSEVLEETFFFHRVVDRRHLISTVKISLRLTLASNGGLSRASEREILIVPLLFRWTASAEKQLNFN